MTLSEEDRAWMKKLHAELYPPRDRRNYIEQRFNPKSFPKPREKLAREEIDRIVGLIRGVPLVTYLTTYGPICGVQMIMAEHEQYPGTGLEPLLVITDEHLPSFNDRTWYEHLLDTPKVAKRKRGAGDVDPDAWDFFASFTHTERNREWLCHYGVNMHFDKTHYDY